MKRVALSLTVVSVFLVFAACSSQNHMGTRSQDEGRIPTQIDPERAFCRYAPGLSICDQTTQAPNGTLVSARAPRLPKEI